MSKKLTMTMVASIMMLTTAALADAGTSFTLQTGGKGGQAAVNLHASDPSDPAAACKSDTSSVALHPGGKDGLHAQWSYDVAVCKAPLNGALQNGNYSKN